MRVRLLTLALSIAALIGCSSRPIRISTPCSDSSPSEIIARLARTAATVGLNFTHIDEDAGRLELSSLEVRTFEGVESEHWVITIREGRVEAYAKSIYRKRDSGSDPREMYYSDRSPRGASWYWAVRNELETMCGARLVFTDE